MWGLLLRRSTLVLLTFHLFEAICASSKKEQDQSILHHMNPKDQSSKALHSHKHSPPLTPTSQDFFLDRRDFVAKQYIGVPIVKQNTLEKHYGNKGFPQMKSKDDKTGKINPNDLGYGDLKRVEDADQSVNEVINSIIDDDKNLAKAMSDETGKPTPGTSEDFDVTIDEYAAKNSGESSYVPTKLAPEIVNGGLQEASQVGGSDQTLHSSEGKTNETILAHSWSVQLDSADQNGSQGNISSIEEAAGSNISNQIGNTSKGGTAKEKNNWNVYREVGDMVNAPFKQSLNSGSVLSGGENSIIANDFLSSNYKMLNLSHEATSYISKNNSLIENTNLVNHGDQVTKNTTNQNFSNKIDLPGDIKDVSNVNSNVTNVISSSHRGNNYPITLAVLGKNVEENNIKNSSNKSFSDDKDGIGSGSHGNATITSEKNNGSLSNSGNVNVEHIDAWPNKDAQDDHIGSSRNSSISGKDSNNIIDDHKQDENAITPSGFLKQHPNAFKVLMEYFRKESSLQQKLRDRLTSLRKTRIDENAIKKSFASVHELEAMPSPPLPLRDFVADLFKFATENVSPKPKSQNILKTKASKQRFPGEKAEKLTSPEKAGRGHSRKVVGRPHNSVQAPKQSLPSRKGDVTFLADFENVTKVANEINGNITKIFQDTINSNSEDSMSPEANASSILGLTEERIGKIIAQNEISGNAESSKKPTEGKGPDESNTIKVGAIGQVESNAMAKTTSLVKQSNAISKAEGNLKEINPVSNEASYITTQNSPSEALYDFIHIKNSYLNSKTMMFKKRLKSLEVSLSQDFFNFWIYHYRSLEEMSIKPEQLRSGIATVGSTDRLERVIKKALKGETINLLIVGGSISAGGGLERDRHDLHGIYYKAFVEWWKNTVTPITTSDLKLNVVAIGGADSEYFSYCIKNYIQDKTDLVIWELAANDYRRYKGRKMDPAKPLEQLTRLLLTLPSQPALIFINFFRGDYYKTTLEQDCPDSEDEGGKRMAEYYKITSLSWRNIVCPQIKTDIRPGNGIKREFTPLTLKTLFSSDGYHPSLLGHAQCATLLISYIRSVFEEVVSREISRLDDGKAEDDNIFNKNNLPQPIYSDTGTPNPMCWTLLTSDFHRQIQNQLPGMRILEANGFEFTNITHWPLRMDRLRCLKALHSDSSLRIKFDVSREVNNKSSTQPTNIAVISHNSFLGSARVWFDNDQYNAVNIEEPAGQRRTQANIIKRVLQPGSHVITIRSITPGVCISALAIL